MISYSLPDQQLRLVSPSTPVTQRLLAITRNREEALQAHREGQGARPSRDDEPHPSEEEREA
jgi:hypothetical protein